MTRWHHTCMQSSFTDIAAQLVLSLDAADEALSGYL